MFLGTLSPPGGDNNLPEPLVKKMKMQRRF